MIDAAKLDFEKMGGLIPAVVVDNNNKAVLMLGFMNKEALVKTIETGMVTFYSRTKERLWTKGETSGNYLHLVEILSDCDNDTLLIYADPKGNVCHTGSYSCFGEGVKNAGKSWLYGLNDLVKSRKEEMPENSYTTKLFNKGRDRIVQKVGEEAVETVIAAKNGDREEILNESADLMFHLIVMLREQGLDIRDVEKRLEERHG